MSSKASLKGLTIFSTGNEELDSRLGGGVPHPAFVIIEGENGTAKTTFAAQLALGALQAGFRVVFFTTESTVKQLLAQTRNVTIDLTKYYIKGQLVIYSSYLKSVTWSPEWVKESFNALLSFLAENRGGFQVAIIDSLTPLLEYLEPGDISRLIYIARLLAADGSSLIVTTHSGVIDEKIAKHLKAAADVYYQLSLASVGGKQVKVLKVVKARGVPDVVEGTVAFDVDPAFGIKIVPIVVAQA
ncbi:putative Flagella-related protein FlaH [Pyrodictium delaneyi]|nr:ATPase domain-containing protein [Pyrodictium delaneyi]ALL01247.1 putative Flagella-related protein FlaH [Pyrodictium delaneyi]